MSVSKTKVQDSQLDFKWSFKPIIFLMRVVLGIDLDPYKPTHSSIRQICCRISHFSFGLIVLVFTIVVNVLHLILTIKSTYDTSPENPIASLNLTQSNLIVIRITAVNETVFNVAIYLIFYVVVVMNAWKSLWFILQQLQLQSPKFDREFYRSCRRITYAGLLSIFVVGNYFKLKNLHLSIYIIFSLTNYL